MTTFTTQDHSILVAYAATYNEMLRFRELLTSESFHADREFLYLCSLPKIKKVYYDLLIEAGANPSVNDEHGQNALFKAARSGNLELLRSLLDVGVNPMQCDESGEIPLSVALRYGNLSVAKCLLTLVESPGAIIDKQESNLLHKAAGGDMFSVAKELIQIHHMDVESRDAAGHTALHIAAYRGSNRILRFLVTEVKAELNALDGEGRTPLFSGAYDRNLLALKFLCEHGADLSLMDANGFTVLAFALSNRQKRASTLLKSYLR